MSAEAEGAQKEAESVLIDFLTSMLTKPQSFLREVANTCFKCFSATTLDQSGLERLLAIVATPNKEAGEFMDGEQAGEDEEDGEIEEIGTSEDEEDSDDEE
jgi:hypothetical protein